MPVTFKSRFINKPNITVDITPEMLKAGDLVAQEIRGNIKDGVDVNGATLTPNAASTQQMKVASSVKFRKTNSKFGAKGEVLKAGKSDPLIAKGRTLISKASYIIKSPGKNRVQITLTDSAHPISGTAISDIGAYNDKGTNRIPARHFFGISETAKKRVLAMMFDRISELVSGVRR